MKSVIIKILILTAIVLSVISYLSEVGPPPNKGILENSASTTEATSVILDSVDTLGDIKVVPVEVTDVKIVLRGTMPNLDKLWSIPDNYSDDAKAIINSRIADITKELKADNDQYDQWIILGNTRKLVGDYDEAKIIWEFASLNWPDSIVAYHNLGEIYGYYLKDKMKAEANMLKVIELNPEYTSEYVALYRLYEQRFGKQDPKTASILIKGLDANPTSPDLMITLASHYKDIGDTINARKYYEMALARAKELSNSKLQTAIEVELTSL